MGDSAHRPGDSASYRFGVFHFDAGAQELFKGGRLVRVRPQSLKLLALLVARPGELIPWDAIQQALWGRETFVDFDQGVNHCVKELRGALNDEADAPRYIQTLPRRGYRFIAAIERVTSGDPAAPPAPASDEGAAAVPLSSSTPAHVPSSGWLRFWLAACGVAVLLTGAALAGLVAWMRIPSPARPGAVTVVPFAASDSVLAAGLAKALSNRLAGQSAVSILSAVRGTAVAGTGRSGPTAASDAAGTELVLDGDLDTSGDAVTVAARLRDGSGVTVWSDRFTVRRDEFFSLETVIAERIAAALDLRLAAADQARLRRRYTSDAAAYEQYLRGRAALARYTPEGTVEAVRFFEAALQRDPAYALARAGLAMASAEMYLRFATAADVERWGARADAETSAALEVGHDLAEAHLARAAVARKREFDWNTTMEASARALLLNASLDQAHFYRAAALYHLGFMEEALLEREKGRALRGADVVEPERIAALVALFSGNFGSARVHLEEVSRLSSRAIGDTYLALAYYYSGHVERGRTMLESLAGQPSASTAARSRAALAGLLAAEGDTGGARREIARVLAADYRDHHVAYSLGAALVQLGELDEADRWLRTAADTGFPCLPWFERDPLVEPLRRRPEFATLQAYVRARRDATLRRTN